MIIRDNRKTKEKEKDKRKRKRQKKEKKKKKRRKKLKTIIITKKLNELGFLFIYRLLFSIILSIILLYLKLL
jgi:hypothetical protein